MRPRERRLVLELVGDVRGRRVLDVGCGDGDLAIDLTKRGARVVGIDSSSVMINAAKQHAERNPTNRRIRCSENVGRFRPCHPPRILFRVAQFDAMSNTSQSECV